MSISQETENRLKSYWAFPLSCPLNPSDLARNGLRLVPGKDEHEEASLVCDECHGRFPICQEYASICERHRQASPHCLFIQQSTARSNVNDAQPPRPSRRRTERDHTGYTSPGEPKESATNDGKQKTEKNVKTRNNEQEKGKRKDVPETKPDVACSPEQLLRIPGQLLMPSGRLNNLQRGHVDAIDTCASSRGDSGEPNAIRQIFSPEPLFPNPVGTTIPEDDGFRHRCGHPRTRIYTTRAYPCNHQICRVCSSQTGICPICHEQIII